MTEDEEKRINAAVAGFVPCGHISKDIFLSGVFSQAWNAVSLVMAAIGDEQAFRVPVTINDIMLSASAPACYTCDRPSEEEIREHFMKHFYANRWRWNGQKDDLWIDVSLADREGGKFTLTLVFYSVND
jgi:hypothetical protein